MIHLKKTAIIFSAAAVLALGLPHTEKPAHAGDAAAGFIGGVVTSKILNNMNRRTRAEEHRAYRSPQPQPIAPAPVPAKALTPQQRIEQLDALAAGGYITKEEYKLKKQAIIDSL